MHPLIRDFPSSAFYQGKITDGVNVVKRNLDSEIERLAKVCRRTAFFDLVNSRETVSERSKTNMAEVAFTLNLVKCLTTIACQGRGLRAFGGKIAIITPYKAQV